MKKLLYIGNKLKNNRTNLSSIHILGNLLEGEGYQIIYASNKTNKIFRLIDMMYTCIISRNKVYYAIIDTYSTQNFYFAFIISQMCRVFNIPYIPNLNGGNLPRRFDSSPKMCNLIFKNAYCNVAPSKYLKESFEIHGYSNLKYIPNTIEIANYPFFKRDYSKPKLLWVRSFSRIYNPLMAVKVLKALKNKGMDAILCMVGPDSDGSMQDVKVLAKKLGVEVRFTGKLSKQEWILLSENYNFFINTTTIDNTPVSVIEAMALGLPIVSTNVGGMPYLIKNDVHGILVKNDDVNHMVKAIVMVLDHPEKRDEMILNARRLAESFDWGVVKLAWREVLG